MLHDTHKVSLKKARICGSCHACCTTLRIDKRPGYSTRLDNGEDISKPAHTPCRYVTKNGCSIYEVRPVVCRRFLCDWMLQKNNHSAPQDIGHFSVNDEIFYIK